MNPLLTWATNLTKASELATAQEARIEDLEIKVASLGAVVRSLIAEARDRDR